MIGRLTALFGVLALLSIPGCGNKGPLYLPPPDAQSPAAQSDESER